MKNHLPVAFAFIALFIIAGCSPQADATTSCPATNCQNSGTVTLTDTICGCDCAYGFTGDSCQNSALGNYNVLRVNTANSSTTNMVATITARSGGISIGLAGTTLAGTWSSSSAFSVNTQTVGGVVYIGSGTFTPNHISMSLTQGGVAYTYQGAHQ